MANNFLTLAQAHGAIRLPISDTSRDTELTTIYIPALEAPIVDMLGPVITATFTGVYDGGRPSIVLDHTDVSNVTLSVNGTDFPTAILDASAGIIYRDNYGTCFPRGKQNLSAQWTAGLYADASALPANIILAARIILAQLWQADQQGQRSNVVASSGEMITTKSGFAVPKRAAELLGYVRLPGF